jgi:hypothetical protein
MSTDDLVSRIVELQTDFERFDQRSPQMEAHILLKSGMPESVRFVVTARHDGTAFGDTEVSTEKHLQLSMELLTLTQVAGAIVSKKPVIIDSPVEQHWLSFLMLGRPLYPSQTITATGATASVRIPNYAHVCTYILGLLKGCLRVTEMAGSGQQELLSPKGINNAANESACDKNFPSWDAFMDAVAVVADGHAVEILRVAISSKSADEKMQLIYRIDSRALGWESPAWARLLQVSDSAIRQTDWWKNERKRLIGGKD